MDGDTFLDLPSYSGVYLALTPPCATELFLQFYQLCIHLTTHVRVDEVTWCYCVRGASDKCQVSEYQVLKPRIFGYDVTKQDIEEVYAAATTKLSFPHQTVPGDKQYQALTRS